MYDPTSKNDQGPAPAQPADNQQKLLELPSHVIEWIYSREITQNNAETYKKFGLRDELASTLAKITGYIILKNVPIERLHEALSQNLNVNQETARQIAIEVAIKQFLPIRDHLPGTENYIKSLGGQLPNPLPPIVKASAPAQEQAEPQQPIGKSAPTDTIIEKDLATAITEKEEIANQDLTSQPIKLADSEMAKLPNIRNWITDYRQFVSNFPEQEIPMLRAKYLYDSANGKNLSEKERIIVGSVLRSYDEYKRLPFSKETGRLMIETIIESSGQQAPQNQSQNIPSQPTAPPRPTPPPIRFPPPTNLPGNNPYREKISDEDLQGPQTPKKPEPKLEGNIINLKDLV